MKTEEEICANEWQFVLEYEIIQSLRSGPRGKGNGLFHNTRGIVHRDAFWRWIMNGRAAQRYLKPEFQGTGINNGMRRNGEFGVTLNSWMGWWSGETNKLKAVEAFFGSCSNKLWKRWMSDDLAERGCRDFLIPVAYGCYSKIRSCCAVAPSIKLG